MDDLSRLRAATAHLDAPFALVDLNAFRANAADMVRRARGKPIRVASKSVRARSLLVDVLARDGYHGIL
jgi:D-serine deaminase-like pyridoxal phosphate-dependent protein